MNTFFYKLTTAVLCTLFLPLGAITEKLQEKLGSDEFSILENPRYVTILLIDPNERSTLLKKEIHLDANEINRLKRNILEDHNYDFLKLKKCKFTPDISLKFENNERRAIYLFVDRACCQALFKGESTSLSVNYDPVHERLNFFLKQLLNDALARNKPHPVKSTEQAR